MAQIPTRTKYRKMQKGQMAGLAYSAQFIEFGEFGMQALDRGWITSQQIEACRVAINRYLNRRGNVIIRIFPDKSVSKKPAETRMGKGKGAPDHWVAVIRPGRILFEVGNVPKEIAREALKRGATKLGMRTRFVEKVARV